jgi:hypothetical protein
MLPILGAGEMNSADDLLAMLQGSLRVAAQNEENVLPEKASEKPDMKSISKLEELVMSRVMDDKVEGNDKMAKTLNSTVKTFQTSIIASTAANQKTIILNVLAFKKCKTSMWNQYKKAIPRERDFWIMGHLYPKCIRAEDKLKIFKRKDDTETKTYTSNLKTLKKLAKIEENKCGNVCRNKKFESYHEQLESLSIYYTRCKKKIGPKIMDVKKGSDVLKKKIKAQEVERCQVCCYEKKM